MAQKKRPFLLLEILIGIALMTLLAVPLLSDPFSLLQKEVAALERIELERLSELQIADVKKKLYLNEIPWETLSQESMGEPIKGEVFIQLPEMGKHRFQTKTYIWSKKHKSDEQKKEEYQLVGVKIEFVPVPKGSHKNIAFLYRFFAKKATKL